ncbi:SMI1/KNR4 family protein [Nocardia mexicana]|uniref:SMI1/KNR4 family protein SUKH-1 n=1 Tax=Nocardia mexicana TaxID=279262 RepID=A0A370H5R0_9NOCA|nr:SMI1/KNR4 family protein [Nocardia mexicana]RDI51716.1 SMI1/KNR4 family protein SUKH-1 [Nocardia mexicana]
MSFMADLTEPLISRGLVAREAVEGCTDDEIATLMRAQHVSQLPQSYREFLAYGGKNPYWLSHTGEWDFDWLVEAKDLAREIAEDYKKDFTPFEEGFVFQTHQGYMFYCFSAEDLSNPDPNFFIFTGNEPIRDSRQSFTQWLSGLADYLPEAIRLREELGLQ